ncbi:protein kinase domain-containing protein [Alloacidobacterium sp.]|uniref:protein kinase domain-containing protein n=1 Tax=Alloacidobacterium sp. TaxID=2951999 RepID=UPI002D6200D6|nr:protein kinase [Alloacidobacterium sp.]HYK34885.1 protein kinase [Alloacidobacterium sp.]
MPLATGTKLDGYELLGLLGAGGMGEVYRARDSALRREVAIKVLPAFVSRDPDRLRRFEQEAQAAAALNHPNILAIHRFGEFDGAPYLVAELLEGSTLRQLLQRGPLPVRKAIDYGIQIARGLAAAHDHGIVHRDLKPENLFVIKDGHVKILDFGLAKLMHRQPEADATAATVTHETDPGMVMGTAGYMSPEQVRGGAVDHRTDIFALGAILYELLSGKRAFQRGTSAETMTAILNDDPPTISQTGANIPPALQRVVNRCLEKNPEQRFHSASDLAFALDALSDSGASPAVGTQAPARRSPKRAVVWSITIIAVVCVVAAAYFTTNRNGGPPLRIAEYTQLTHNGHAGYARGTDGSRIYLQSSVKLSMQQVSVSGGEIEPVSSITLPEPELLDVSPDGSTFLVKSYEKGYSPSMPLYAVQVVGGSHRYLADAADAAWSPDGKLVAYSTANGDIDIINSDGTGARKLASVGGAALDPSWSPDGRTIRFFRDRDYSLWEITSNGANLHPLLAGWHPSDQKCCGNWSPDGKVFAFSSRADRAGTSQIYALDERRRLFRPPANEPIQLTSGPIRWSAPIFSKDRKKIFATGFTLAGELVRLDPKSNQFQPFLGGISADSVAFSKDGQFIAYVSYPDDILWRANRDGSDRVPLTSPPMLPNTPKWSPDGSQILFTDDEGRHACIVPSRGGSPQRALPEGNGLESDPGWSPDGHKIIFATGLPRSSESSIRIFDLASHQIATLPGSDGKFSPHWSPDGQYIVADSLDATTMYIFDIQTQHWATLYTGITGWATWSTDSRFIYFLRYGDDRAILRIPITGGEGKVVVALKDSPFTGTNNEWFGLDPTDAPLLMRDVSTSDVYSLTLEEK